MALGQSTIVLGAAYVSKVIARGQMLVWRERRRVVWLEVANRIPERSA